MEPKEDIKFTPDYDEKEPIFWTVFEELSNNGNGLVDYYSLQENRYQQANSMLERQF